MARKTIRVELNDKGIKQLLRSEEVQEAVNEIAKKGAAQANRNAKTKGAKYGVRGFQGKDRYRAHIGVESKEATLDEREHRSLSRLLGGGWL